MQSHSPFFMLLRVLICSLAACQLSAQSFVSVSQLTGLSEEVATAFDMDPDGNRYVCGFFGNTMDVPGKTITSLGFRDGFLVKYDANGQFLWEVVLGSTLNDEAQDVGVDGLGNVYVLLNHNDTVQLAEQSYFSPSNWSLLKFDPDGNFLLQTNPFVEVPQFWALQDMAVNIQGDIVLTGRFGFPGLGPDRIRFPNLTLETYPRSNNPNNYVPQMWVATYDAQLSFVWAQASKASSPTGATSWEVAIDDTGNVAVAGIFGDDPPTSIDIRFGATDNGLTATGNQNSFLVRYDSTGSVLWSTSYTSIPNDPTDPSSISNLGPPVLAQSSNGFISLGGIFTGKLGVGNDTISTPGAQDPLNPFLSPSHIYLISFQSDGEVRWLTQLETKDATPSALAVGTTGNTYIGGILRDSLLIGSTWLVDDEVTDLFVVQLDSEGEPVWGDVMTDAGFEPLLEAMHVTSEGDLLLCGAVEAPAQFGTITLTDDPVSSCCSNAFVALLDTSLFTSVDRVNPLPLSVFPNPGTDGWMIDLGELSAEPKLSLKLYDVTGQLVRHLQIPTGHQSYWLEAYGLPVGRYYIQVETNRHIYTQTLIKVGA